MKKNLFPTLILSGLLLTSAVCAAPAPRTIPIPAGTAILGAASAPAEINHPDFPYFPQIDYYSLTSNEHLTILTNYPTYQQTTEETCGPAAALTMLWYLGDTSQTEASLAKTMKTRPYPYGTIPKNMFKAFRSLGWQIDSNIETGKTFATYEEFQAFALQNLKNGLPILVENVEWGGHWHVIIGYDTMGTPSTLDDTLIFADPYDTSDHRQDGYTLHNGERFFYTWFMPQDPQPKQTWIVLHPKKVPVLTLSNP